MIEKKTAQGLAEHARTCLVINTVYTWGGLGEPLTRRFIRLKKKTYPNVYTREYRKKFKICYGRGYRCFDCSGLIKNYMMGGLEHFRLQPELDMNTSMLLQQAEKSGTIDTLPELPGVCLYMEGKTEGRHVGIYMGNQIVIECTSNKDLGNGVIQTKLSDRIWTHWFYCPTVNYEEM